MAPGVIYNPIFVYETIKKEMLLQDFTLSLRGGKVLLRLSKSSCLNDREVTQALNNGVRPSLHISNLGTFSHLPSPWTSGSLRASVPAGKRRD